VRRQKLSQNLLRPIIPVFISAVFFNFANFYLFGEL
jgi:hypothetical protein